MGSVVIRGYVPADLAHCRQLWTDLTQHHRDLYDDQTIGGGEPGLYFDEHLRLVGEGRIWVAEEDGQVIGLVGLIHRGEEAEVEPAVVDPAHRGGGVGHMLVSRAIAEARALGVHYVSLRPVARNLRAIKLFHSMGFRTMGHVQLFIDLKAQRPGQWKSGIELFGLEFSS